MNVHIGLARARYWIRQFIYAIRWIKAFHHNMKELMCKRIDSNPSLKDLNHSNKVIFTLLDSNNWRYDENHWSKSFKIMINQISELENWFLFTWLSLGNWFRRSCDRRSERICRCFSRSWRRRSSNCD